MSKSRPELDYTMVVAELPVACADESAAVEFFERKRWGADLQNACCPECGSVGVKKLMQRNGKRNPNYIWRCNDCTKRYTVRTGSIFEETRLPMHKWARAFWEAAVCKNGVSALELMRKIQCSYKTALFVLHRIRFTMEPDTAPEPKLSGTVEIDETFVGGKPRRRTSRPVSTRHIGRGTPKTPVVGVVERGGNVRTKVVANVTSENIKAVLDEHVEKGSRIMSDEFKSYKRVAREHGIHRFVRHGLGEYVNFDDRTVHTNTIEGFFSRVKRKLNGTHHAVSKEHLHRYLAECAFIYNCRDMNDGQRIEALLKRAEGKRLTVADYRAGA